MFNPFRAIKYLWAKPTSAISPSETTSSAPVSAAPPANGASTPRTRVSSAATEPAYGACMNYPSLPTTYAVPATFNAAPPPLNVFGGTSPAVSVFCGRPLQHAPSDTGARTKETPPERDPFFGHGIGAPCTDWEDLFVPEATDYLPPTAPPTPAEDRDIPIPTTESTHDFPNCQPTAEEETTTPPPTHHGDRTKLQPKRQRGRQQKPVPSPNTPPPQRQRSSSVSLLIYEEETEDNPLPEGYSGTWQDRRYYTMEMDDHKCGDLGEHKLICGHLVHSPEPCGQTAVRSNTTCTPLSCVQAAAKR
ncbi:hypothetical protein BDW02DRAFT_142300 [Decorospora gaudefroyi]|uniref:Uncharacterized protein n=1 Tax=Decorospora gaudefroyi TaxID=184978 RepID=A0A6A5KNI3_9PLEO|nr:hypothetical protein BDW02DRAFT_142300 [Decorospora gaudefroyi]